MCREDLDRKLQIKNLNLETKILKPKNWPFITTVLDVTLQSASTMKMEAKGLRNADICETLRRHIPEDTSLYTQRRENVKYHISVYC
jgi:hypothetical protein